jgi:hypothetical protein
MKGADIVVFGAACGELQDHFSLDYVRPNLMIAQATGNFFRASSPTPSLPLKLPVLLTRATIRTSCISQ